MLCKTTFCNCLAFCRWRFGALTWCCDPVGAPAGAARAGPRDDAGSLTLGCCRWAKCVLANFSMLTGIVPVEMSTRNQSSPPY
jgi:hypothetical protein